MFHGDSGSYADTIGLAATIRGEDPQPRAGGLAGYSYSPIAKLDTPVTVEQATNVVTACLYQQLTGTIPLLLTSISHVIGEMHDNIASHAHGAGFSALQYYPAKRCVLFAIADTGVGLLANAARAVKSIHSHQKAIHWCFGRGHTSAGAVDDWAQSAPWDSNSPYPSSVPIRTDGNNHAGQGLWQLLELVKRAKGSFWVWSGDCELKVPWVGTPKYSQSSLFWQGLAIEVMIPVERDLVGTTMDLTHWSERLGI